MANHTQKLEWTVDGKRYAGHAEWQGDGPKPAVLVCHAFGGMGDFERARAAQLAELGYVGVAIDVYGAGVRGETRGQCQALMKPLMADRALLRRRLEGALDAVRGMGAVDGKRVAAIGFCFGGLCALDLARSGAELRGVVSFHGLFYRPDWPTAAIKAKVLALHGYDDPMVKPEAMVGFCDEMTAAKADWQVCAYGDTMHAFTNPEADDADFGTVYQPRTCARAYRAMERFLAEAFG